MLTRPFTAHEIYLSLSSGRYQCRVLRAWTLHESFYMLQLLTTIASIDVVSSGGGRGAPDVHDNDRGSWRDRCSRRLHSDDLDATLFHDQDV